MRIGKGVYRRDKGPLEFFDCIRHIMESGNMKKRPKFTISQYQNDFIPVLSSLLGLTGGEIR